jgi:hypothetical protein
MNAGMKRIAQYLNLGKIYNFVIEEWAIAKDGRLCRNISSWLNWQEILTGMRINL